MICSVYSPVSVAKGQAVGAHGFDDGEGFDADALVTQAVAAVLKAFFDDDAAAFEGGAGGANDVDEALEGAAVGEEVVDDEDVVVAREVFLCEDDVVDAFVGEGFDFGVVHVAVKVDALGFLGEDDGYVEILRGDAGDADATGFDGEYFRDWDVCEAALEFFANLVDEGDVHLMVEEAVDFQDVARLHDAISEDALFQ